MGIFDGFLAMKDIVTGSIAAAKASGRLEELADQAMADYDDVLSPEQAGLYKTYQTAKATLEDMEVGSDAYNEQLQKSEDACVSFVSSLVVNTQLPKSYRNNLKSALEEYAKTNDTDALFEKTMMRYAKTDEEREAVRQLIAESNEE